MIGISLRHAIALGLHLRNEDPAASESRKDNLAYTWWTVYSLESLLNTITGRPPVVNDEYRTMPLPDSSSKRCHRPRSSSRHATCEAPAHSSSHFPSSDNNSEFNNDSWTTEKPYLIGRFELSLLTRKTQQYLYSPQTTSQSWQVSSSHLSLPLEFLVHWTYASIVRANEDLRPTR
jgi:hypothetical protein